VPPIIGGFLATPFAGSSPNVRVPANELEGIEGIEVVDAGGAFVVHGKFQ
jgi:hypothetical protein